MKARFYLIVTPLALLLHALLYLSPRGESIENYFLDLWFNLRGTTAASQEVLLVGMDEDSYQNLNVPFDQAWPRSLHAQLLRKLKVLGAKRAVFDVLFLGPGSDPEVDRELSKAIKEFPTVLSVDFGLREQDGYELTELLYPYEPFLNSAAQIALAGVPEDTGYVRRFMIPDPEQMEGLPSLAQAAAALPIDAPQPGIRDIINYFGPSGSVERLSYYQVLEEDPPLPAELVKDKVVFIGLALRSELGPAQKDSFLTPFTQRGRTYGVEVHATSAANLLNRDWIRRADPNIELIVLSLLLGGAITLLFTARPLGGGLYLLAISALWFLIANGCFRAGLFVPGASAALLVLPSTYLLSTFYFYLTTRKAQRQIQRAFEFYISPEMARTVSLNPEALKLGGKKEIATVMFTDIAGFSRISESIEAEQVAAMLNAYFTEVMDEIFQNEGTLIKFIGDAAFAIWGAPVKSEDHALKACQTAIKIQQEVVRFNASNRFPPLNTRIGVHTGPMVVGNLGSSRRFDFTAVGDAVNLCSRIEGINKYLGTSLLVSDTVAEQIDGTFTPLSMGAIQPAGKDDVVELFTILAPEATDDVSKLWNGGIQHFKQQSWELATKWLLEAASLDSRLLDPANFFIEQIEQLRVSADNNWRGEIVLFEK